MLSTTNAAASDYQTNINFSNIGLNLSGHSWTLYILETDKPDKTIQYKPIRTDYSKLDESRSAVIKQNGQ